MSIYLKSDPSVTGLDWIPLVSVVVYMIAAPVGRVRGVVRVGAAPVGRVRGVVRAGAAPGA